MKDTGLQEGEARGLTSREAQSRLKAEGYNELPRAEHRTLPRIALEVIREPMFGLLIAAGLVYLLLGDLVEALMLLAFASVSIAITLVQESRSEKVLEALRDLASPRALVIRGGERQRIPGREVVRGDLIVLGEGDRVPADALVIQAADLEADESLLTGESVPVRKKAAAARNERIPRPGGEDLPFVFSGTLIVRGQGIAEVRATGPRSEMGQIGQALREIESAPPRLTLETRALVRIFALLGLGVCGAAIVLYGLWRGSWLEALLAGIALGMSMLPEEFPVVLTVFTVMGAMRISRARVLTRRAAAIETLGAATVLCTDKTGTLTENRMSVAALAADDGQVLLLERGQQAKWTDKLRHLVECGSLASLPGSFDPMDKAFLDLNVEFYREACAPARKRELIRTYGLRPDLLAVTQAWKIAGDENYFVVTKGAPEAVADLCRFGPEAQAILPRVIGRLASGGMRVVALAEARFYGEELPDSPRGFEFSFAGLAGLADPLRPSVPEAVRECRSAGIRVVMITGDHPATALAIAHNAGLETGLALTGADLDSMDDAELGEKAASACIFARILPGQKLRIIRALKAKGEVVAMTGDGVNDAPSLKAADIGIAMGGRGTDVAREASDLVLLDDDFGSIVKTIRLGRRIYDNLRKAMGYILALHVPIAGLALLPLLTGLPIIFLPVHIAFLEMIIDPVCAVVFEAEQEEKDIMQRPPRAAADRLFSRWLVMWGLLQGALACAIVFGIFLQAVRLGLPSEEVRAVTFVTLVLANFGLVLVNRSFESSLREAVSRNNPALWWVSAIAAFLLGTALVFSPARSLFRFGQLHSDDLAVAVAAAAALVILAELLKRFWRNQLSA